MCLLNNLRSHISCLESIQNTKMSPLKRLFDNTGATFRGKILQHDLAAVCMSEDIDSQSIVFWLIQFHLVNENIENLH